jgi:hypothetical protein
MIPLGASVIHPCARRLTIVLALTALASACLPKLELQSQGSAGNPGGSQAPDPCSDKTVNGNETGEDCGGPDCKPCELGAPCLKDRDCNEGRCSTTAVATAGYGYCISLGCREDECGGKCARCAPGLPCTNTEDCVAGSECRGGVCCGAPCSGVCRQCELRTGACIPAPPSTKATGCEGVCDAKGDCLACHNRTLDNSEGDTDCGGPCAKCENSRRCNSNDDCASCNCQMTTSGGPGVCAPANCQNGVLDGCETDVDCGGPCGATCGAGQTCKTKGDCLSLTCTTNRCGDAK